MTPPLERLGFVGASYRQLGFERLGTLALPPEDKHERRRLAAALGGELVYLATCNRLECYTLSTEAFSAHELRARACAFFSSRGVELEPNELRCEVGPGAARHLLEVASSLDSLVVGETEIAGQLRRALGAAKASGEAGKELVALCERALACAKRVRRETRIGEFSLSVGNLAVRKVRQHFGSEGPRSSVILGVGPMSRKVLSALTALKAASPDQEREILLVNRTRSRAEELAKEFGVRATSLEELRQNPPARVDLLFTATSANEPVVDRALLEPGLGDHETIVVDLGVPADVDPEVGSLPRVRLIGMQQLARQAEHNGSLLDAEVRRAQAIVEHELRRLEREAESEALVAESLESLLSVELSHLAREDSELLGSFFQGLGRRLCRQPLASGH